MSQERSSGAIDVDEYLESLGREAEEERESGGRRGRGIVKSIARLLSYNTVVHREEVNRLSKKSSAGRQILMFLSKSGLIYKSRSGYVVSIPLMLLFYKHYKTRWEKEIERVSQVIQADEVERVKKAVEAACGTPLERFIDNHVALNAALLPLLEDLVRIPLKHLPEKCDARICIEYLLGYSRWLLLVITGLLEFQVKGTGPRDAVRWLKDLSRYWRALPEEADSVGREGRDSQEEYSLYYSYDIFSETAEALLKIALELLYFHKKPGGYASVMKEAVEWAVQMYKNSVGANRASEVRARYYAKAVLEELSRAIIVEVATRILLT